MRTSFAAIFVLTLFLGTCGWAAPTPASVPVVGAAEPLVWPKPPEPARIRYECALSGPKDMGIAKSLLRRLIDALSGGVDERFVRPTGVAERDGVIYVADPGAHALWILDAGRRRSTKVVEVADLMLVSPVAVAVRPDGAVFVADTGLKKVFLVARDGTLMRVAAQDNMERPAGVAYDAQTQQLYVADAGSDRIAVFGANGELMHAWGSGGDRDGDFNHPTHLAMDSSGTLLVVDALNFRIQAFNRTGGFLWKFGHQGDGSGEFAAPKGVAADSEGHVYVVDALFDAVQIFDHDGTLLLGFGETGTQAGQFWLPGGLFINADNEIFVADGYNRRVQVFRYGEGSASSCQGGR